jgi:hypothetical protein
MNSSIFEFTAVTQAERIISIERVAKDERSARRKLRRSKFGRSLRDVRVIAVKAWSPLCKAWPNCHCIVQGREKDCQ